MHSRQRLHQKWSKNFSIPQWNNLSCDLLGSSNAFHVTASRARRTRNSALISRGVSSVYLYEYNINVKLSKYININNILYTYAYIAAYITITICINMYIITTYMNCIAIIFKFQLHIPIPRKPSVPVEASCKRVHHGRVKLDGCFHRPARIFFGRQPTTKHRVASCNPAWTIHF